MSTLIFLIILVIFGLGYSVYGGFISRFFGIEPTRKTPAHTHYDGVDYVPAKNWLVLFGHHFASIAGAGPIVGPIFAYVYWGWFGALLWIIFGCIFMGAVHDFASLFISVREGGSTIGQITQKYISKRASIIFLIFLLFALVIVNAVFSALCAETFKHEPRIVLPSLGLIPLAILFGLLVYRLKVNTPLATIFGLVALAYLVSLGNQLPIGIRRADPYFVWVAVLFLYCFFASVAPVNLLLQPRDYLCSFFLFFGLLAALIGVVIKPQPLPAVHFLKPLSAIGPLFPLMFITVACGSISGFHSLVASGTTSKQLGSEKEIKKVGYGGMIVEGVLAVLALFCVAFGLKTLPQGKNPEQLFALGFSKVAFFLGGYAQSFAVLLLNAFILTTLDTATRISRFIVQELLHLKNKYIATFIVVAISFYLCISGTYKTLWPIFGASNQLVAGLALLVASAYLMAHKKKCTVTFIPALLMLFITVSALLFKIFEFFKKHDYILFVMSVTLAILSLFIIMEFRKKVKNVT